MATRPWITAEEVIGYSDFADVQNRASAKLTFDIQRAEAFIIAYCHRDFSEDDIDDEVVPIPDDVKTADILLAEYYAHNAQAIAKVGAKQSESFDDYSYTMAASDMSAILKALGIDALLNPYVVSDASGNMFMRLRKL